MKKFVIVLFVLFLTMILPYTVQGTTPVSRFYKVPTDNEVFFLPHYAAIVYIDGTEIIAVNSTGAIISNGITGTDDTAVIQTAVSSVTRGTVFIKNSETSYIITSTISVPSYVYVQSDGAKLDVTGCNDIVFKFNADESFDNENGMRSGIDGFSATGTITNRATKLVWISNIARGVSVTNIQTKNVYNVVTIRGASYDALIESVESWNAGVFISIEGFTLNAIDYMPNQATIIDCEISNSADQVPGTSYGIKILKDPASETALPEGIKIANCWLEGVTTSIYSEGIRLIIIGNTLLPTSSGAGSSIYIASGGQNHISDNYMYCPAFGYGIYNTVYDEFETITGNTLTGFPGSSVGIYTTTNAYGLITGNRISSVSTVVQGAWCSTTIVGNSFWGASSSNSTALNLTGADSPLISGNIFTEFLKHITGSPTNAVMGTNDVNDASSIVNLGEGSTGWVKEGATASVADGGTISHGLGVSPNWIIVTPTVANQTIAVTAKNTTTFTVAIKKNTDGSAGTRQTIYWRCGI